MKISDLAAQADIPVATVRYYEQQGLLPPAARLANNYRHYGVAHVERLLFIVRCRSLDMSLAEIASLLAYQDGSEGACAHTHALLDGHIAQVAARITQLQGLQSQLQTLRAQCAAGSPSAAGQEAAGAACGILQQLGNA